MELVPLASEDEETADPLNNILTTVESHVRIKGQSLTELGLRSKRLPLLITMDQSS